MVVLALSGLLAAAQAVRSAAVADRARRPELAAALWPGHPDVITDRLVLAAAAAGARGQSLEPAVLADVRALARRAPLSPDPFLVAAAVAALEKRGDSSERLLLAARDRDPRSRATRYLLAERYLTTGRIAAGLMEMKVLTGLSAEGGNMVPALAAFAQSPGAIPALRRFFAQQPEMEAWTLTQLAADPRNARIILALASNRRNPNPDWRSALLSSLVASGQYEQAFLLWRSLSPEPMARGLFNPDFAGKSSFGPFDWVFPADPGGVAEPDGRGGLKVLYYGREAKVLARQLVRLAPGTYRLAMQVDGGSGGEGGLRWVVRCATGGELAAVAVKPGAAGGSFRLPPACPAIWLELSGQPGEMSTGATTERTIRGLRLEPEARP